MLSDIKGINRDVWLDVKIRYYNLLFIHNEAGNKSELMLSSLLKLHFD